MTYGMMTNGWVWLPYTSGSATTGARVKPARVQVVAEPPTTAKLQVKTEAAGTPAGCSVTVQSS
jgi:hypothetical protein